MMGDEALGRPRVEPSVGRDYMGLLLLLLLLLLLYRGCRCVCDVISSLYSMYV